MTRSSPSGYDLTAARRGHFWTRNCGHAPEASPIATSGVEDSGDPRPDWFFTQGVELVVDHCVTSATGYSSSVSQGYTAAPH
jgi:hypothetical protein